MSKRGPDANWYSHREWVEHVRPRQLQREPLCAFCQLRGHITEAKEVDHIWRPNGDWHLRRDSRNLQSLCNADHLLKSNAERAHKDDSKPLVIKLGIGADGWPILWTRPPKPEPAKPVFA
jgi:5-methylcytosine-specific restriction endonuclease McrA